MCIVNTHKRSRRQAEQFRHMFQAQNAAMQPNVDPVSAKSVTPEPPALPTGNSGRAKKVVAFAPVEWTVASYIPARSELSDEEKCGMWLCPAELDNIRHRARETFLHLRELQRLGSSGAVASEGETSDGESEVLRRYREQHVQQQQQQPNVHHPCVPADEEDLSCHRGFEGRLSAERMRNRVVANRAVLRYSRQLRAKESAIGDQSLHLALLSSELSRWSREIALSTGQADFLDSYEMFRGMLPQPKTAEEIGVEHPFPISGMVVRKRAAHTTTEAEDQGRRVRSRAC